MEKVDSVSFYSEIFQLCSGPITAHFNLFINILLALFIIPDIVHGNQKKIFWMLD